MNIIAVSVTLTEDHWDTLREYCSIEIDGVFAVKDLKVVEMDAGHLVAMPNRVATQKCIACCATIDALAKFCFYCGSSVPNRGMQQAKDSDRHSFADIAYPITAKCPGGGGPTGGCGSGCVCPGIAVARGNGCGMDDHIILPSWRSSCSI